MSRAAELIRADLRLNIKQRDEQLETAENWERAADNCRTVAAVYQTTIDELNEALKKLGDEEDG